MYLFYKLLSLEQSRVEIALMSRNKKLYCRQCDLSSQESIRKFADKFKKGLDLYLDIDYNSVLLCNFNFNCSAEFSLIQNSKDWTCWLTTLVLWGAQNPWQRKALKCIWASITWATFYWPTCFWTVWKRVRPVGLSTSRCWSMPLAKSTKKI